MSRLKARVVRLESAISTGLEAELASLSDEEIYQRLAQLSGVSVEGVRARSPEEKQRRQDELLAAMTQADVLDLMRQAPRLLVGSLERWRELQQKSTA